LANIQKKYDASKISIVEKTREIKALGKKVKSLEQELTFDKPWQKSRKSFGPTSFNL